ncbi:MAG: redoxin domain-containing protein, partial [Planctomycetaceae bacterium]
MSVRFRLLSGIFAGVLISVHSQPVAGQLTPERAFTDATLTPLSKDVDIETPAAADIPKCKVEVERTGTTSGYAVFGPQGQILRRFVDTGDDDDKVDQLRFYKNGLEVYRDIDTNGDQKIDECRWLNTGGTRWGLDTNNDKKIDQWKIISAEEASREAIKAIAAGDAAAFAAVLISPADVRTLGLSAETTQRFQAIIKDPVAALNAAFKGSSLIKRDSKWVRFDSSMLMPNVVPAESGIAGRDLNVYENVMAIVDTAGKTGFVQIGEMVRVTQVDEAGQTVRDVWKLTAIPRPIDTEKGDITLDGGGTLMTAALSGASGLTPGGGAEPSPEMKQIIEQLQKLDQAAQSKPDAPKAEIAAYNAQRALLLGRLADAAPTANERETWRKQQIDQIAAAVQLDAFPNGVETLTSLETEIRKRPDGAPLVPYVVYRRMMADYNAQVQLADASQRVEVQTKWLESLQKYITDFPESPDAADAMLQIAMVQEFGGKVTEAKGWYTKIAEGHPQTQAGTIATGALRRFNLKGQPIVMAGPVLGTPGTLDVSKLKGKVVAVLFWATWCRPCTEELPQVLELYKQHKAAGFEVVGVNVDSPGAPIKEYIQQHKIPWPSIHEEGGLQSG